jgi:hypothetical protein
MSRNLKREYLKKLHAIETRNGYRVDLLNYMYNPAHGYEYPALVKSVSETENEITKRRIYYMKFWDGSGAYEVETYTGKKNGDTWQLVNTIEKKVIEANNRFNLNKLIQLAETF